MSEWMSRLIAKYTEVNEGKFLIPEEIPANERTAFHGAAAAASKAGKTHFNFNGKKHPVTMKKDTAKAIADDVKEDKCKECDCDDCECEKNEAYNEPQGQAKRMMSPLQKARMDKEKADRDRDGKLKPGVIKKEENLDEISIGKMMKYGKAAGKDIEKNRNTVKTALDQPASPKKAEAGLKSMKTLRKRSRGSDMYVNKMTGRSKVKPTAEAYENIKKATHQGPSSPPGEGLSPSAKDQLAKKMPTPEPIDEPKVDAKNFATFRKGLKAAPKRPGDNNKGDKNVVK